MISTHTITVFLLFLLCLPIYVYGQGVEASKIRRSTFAKLGSPVEGQVREIPDGTVGSPCTGGSTKVFAYANGSSWVCTTHGPVTAGSLPSGIDAAKIADGSVSNAEFQRIDFTSSGQTQLDAKENVANKENTTIDTSTSKYPTVNLLKTGLDLKVPTSRTVAGKALSANITIACGDLSDAGAGCTGGAGITDAGGAANVLLKRTGVNTVGDGQIIDDGSVVSLVNGNFEVSATGVAAGVPTNLNGDSTAKLRVSDGVGSINYGDIDGNGNSTKVQLSDSVKTITQSAGTESSVIDGTAHTQVFTSTVSESHLTPLWKTGTTGVEFQVEGAGRIVKYNNAVAVKGQLLIGNDTPSGWDAATLTPGMGISIINGTGNITITADPLTSGAPLSCLVSNTALSAATGTVYSSPGYGGTPLAAATEAAVGWAVPRAGTINALQVYSGTTAKVNTPSTVVTVRKNGVDTALTLTLTQTVSTLSADNTHSFTVARGDIITVSFTTTGAAAVSTSIAGVSFLLN